MLGSLRTRKKPVGVGLINVLFVYILGIIFVLAYAFWVHWLIGLVIFLVVPTLGITIFLISRLAPRCSRELSRKTSES